MKRLFGYLYLLYKLQCVIGILATEKCRIRATMNEVFNLDINSLDINSWN